MTEKHGIPISRRQFARRAAVASAVASIAPAAALGAGLASGTAQTPPASQSPASSSQPQLPSDMSKLSPESQAEVDSRFQLILAQYGSRFSDEQKADLHRLCIVAQPSLDHVRAYKAENWDGPGLYLKPLFEREKKPKPAAQPAPPAAKTSGAATKP